MDRASLARHSPDKLSDPRLLAVEVVDAVRRKGRSLSQVLTAAERKLPNGDGVDRALLRERVYGLLRYAPRLDLWLNTLVRRPLRERDVLVARLIELGLYELFFLRTPNYAAVNEAVRITGLLGRPWAGSLVNGVLRNAQRQKAKLLALADSDEQARTAHPEWLIERIRMDWPDDAENIFSANNTHPPMTLRINHLKSDVETYAEQLKAVGITAVPGKHAPDSLILTRPVDVGALPGFKEGWVSVQDEAAQLACGLLHVESGHRVLDACAAPGGKTAHLLEHARGPIDVTAVEINPDRLTRVAQTLDRLGLKAHLIAADAERPVEWWDGRFYDRILVDAPCSATGVIRRHPDIKLLRRQADINPLMQHQQALLDALWPLLAPNGRLVYATCSILLDENQAIVKRFIES
ncbi:16S rRNA (cytosine(967)-C(5))-methyltransferase RsmB, partial [Acidihalobacter prosperus]